MGAGGGGVGEEGGWAGGAGRGCVGVGEWAAGGQVYLSVNCCTGKLNGCLHHFVDGGDEELAEVREELAKHQEGTPASRELQAEIGDLLFIVSKLARKLGVDREVALEGTNEKFLHRFDQIEKGLKKDNITLLDATLEQMDVFWNAAK